MFQIIFLRNKLQWQNWKPFVCFSQFHCFSSLLRGIHYPAIFVDHFLPICFIAELHTLHTHNHIAFCKSLKFFIYWNYYKFLCKVKSHSIWLFVCLFWNLSMLESPRTQLPLTPYILSASILAFKCYTYSKNLQIYISISDASLDST